METRTGRLRAGTAGVALPEELQSILRRHRATTDNAISDAFEALRPGSNVPRAGEPKPWERALLRHALFHATRAAEQGDEHRGREAIALVEALDGYWPPAGSTPDAPVALVSAADCQPEDSAEYAATLYLAAAATLRAAPALPLSRLEHALGVVEAAGFAPLVGAAVGAIVLLRERDPAGVHDSYTVTPLPGTVFIDWSTSSVRTAESIVHEAAHSILNELLDATGSRLPDDRTWYSVWKATQRPAFGILHAGFAFAMVLRFLRACLDHDVGDPWEEAYCRERLRAEGENMQAMEKSLQEVIACVSDKHIAAFLRAEVERVLALASRAASR
jgi:HEXXH motif-containing protein